MDPKALHKIGYGLYVVTSVKDSELNGQIANTVFQITSEPPTIAVSINKSNLTWEFIRSSAVFAVSVLCQDTPLDFIGRFGFKSGRDTDKLEGIDYKIGQTKSPVVIDNAVSYLEAEVINEMDMDTHTVFAGRVVDAEVLTDEFCMTYEYYHRIKRGVTPKTAPSYIEGQKAEPPSSGKYQCTVCGWIYDPKLGDPNGSIVPGTLFEQVPNNWVCPVCGAAKSVFEKI